MQHIALMLAGFIGSATAVLHGVLTHRLMIKPLARQLAAAPGMSSTIRRIIPPLLHFSTFNWFVGGVALVIVANVTDPGPRLAISLLVGSMFAYAALANAWTTRGRHPGWMLMAVAVVLIAIDIAG